MDPLSIEHLAGLLSPDAVLAKRVEALGSHKKLAPSARKRIERKAAQSISAKEVSQWQDVVNANREASQLDLRPAEPAQLSLDSIVRDRSKDEMQSRIDSLLGIQYEPVEAAKPATKARSDEFFKYLKHKRIARIKSKLYHKIKKKQKV